MHILLTQANKYLLIATLSNLALAAIKKPKGIAINTWVIMWISDVKACAGLEAQNKY
jgi:hypothetical protein